MLQRIMKRSQVVLSGSAPVPVPPGPSGGAPGAGDWLARLRPGLPAVLRSRLLDVLEKPGELVLFVESAAWAGRIRLSLPELAPLAAGRRLTVRLNPLPARGKAAKAR